MRELAHLYFSLCQILPADQRCNHYLSALARKDDAEAKVLVASRPRVVCERPDPAFGLRFERVFTLAMRLQVEFDAKVRVAMAANHSAIVAKLRTSESPRARKDATQAAKSHRRAIAAAKGVLEGWQRFCDGHNIDGDAALKAAGLDPAGALPLFSDAATLQKISADVAAVQETAELLAAIWNKPSF